MNEHSNNSDAKNFSLGNGGKAFRIKVCGLTEVNQVRQLNELGIEFAGFNFYRRSPRYVHKSMPSTVIKKIRGKINKVGVFVDEDVPGGAAAYDQAIEFVRGVRHGQLTRAAPFGSGRLAETAQAF